MTRIFILLKMPIKTQTIAPNAQITSNLYAFYFENIKKELIKQTFPKIYHIFDPNSKSHINKSLSNF